MGALYAILGGSLLVWIGLSYLVTRLVGVTGVDEYILWAGLSAIGVVGAALFAWWKMRNETTELPPELASAAEAGSGDEIDLIVKDSEAKLAASRIAGASIGNLPLVFVVGEQGSTKTSVVMNSGLTPELLAGQVYGDNNMIVSTRTANVWLGAGNTLFAEAGAKVLAEPARWVRLIRRLKPGNLKSVVGGSGQAPRAGIVCVNAEIFTQAGAADTLAAMARNLNERLGNISQALGISFPVYVVFTRADRLPFFLDYVKTLNNDEATQVLGATLPLRTSSGGIFAEEESQRLSQAFDTLFHSLADHRVDFLPRETDAEKVPGAYEFPREFRKLRTPLVSFLVDLCRPSALRVSPFLRGFYFSGVRPITVTETPVTAAATPQRPVSAASSATGVFQIPAMQAPQAQASAYATMKRVPQWVFLTRLFHGVILQDRAALSASVASTKTSTAQRVLLGIAAALCLLLALGWTISFFKNRALIGASVTAAEAIPASEAVGTNLASLDSLQRLENLRQQLETLTKYKTEGHPFSLGMGLYAGDDLYPHVRAAYYNRFAQLLFRQAQGSLVAHLGGVPVAPGPNDDYGLTYEILKGYLITTTASDKASDASPAPILLSRWAEGRGPDPARMQLAEKQFRFYAKDLKNGNPFSSTADLTPVSRGRAYLSQFSGIERVYQFMLSSAGKNTVNYNRDVKDSAQAVLNNRDIPGAFTKPGYAFMQDALRRADQFFGGERWVLCEATGNVPATNCTTGNIDRAKLTQDLSARYVSDFIQQWRNYFKNTTVLRYSDLKDASKKLNLQAGPQSPILGVFWLASQNTGVDYTKIPGADKIGKAFQVSHAVVPANQADRYVSPGNQPYHSALGQLQAAIDAAANMPQIDPGTATSTLNNATMAKGSLRQVAQSFNIDQEAHLEQIAQKLLEDPITNAEALLRGIGPKELNGKGGALCSQISPILNKFPFNPASPNDATVAEVNQLLKPGEGALWAFYDLNLKPALAKQGTQYVPTGQIPLTPAFVSFFNSLARLSDALYKGGPDPKLTYTVRPIKVEGAEDVVLTIDGQALQTASGQAKQFTWPGVGGAKFTSKTGTPLGETAGIWAAFRLFQAAERYEPAGTGYNLDFLLSIIRTSSAPRNRIFIDLSGAGLLFPKPTAMHCVATVAK